MRIIHYAHFHLDRHLISSVLTRHQFRQRSMPFPSSLLQSMQCLFQTPKPTRPVIEHWGLYHIYFLFQHTIEKRTITIYVFSFQTFDSTDRQQRTQGSILPYCIPCLKEINPMHLGKTLSYVYRLYNIALKRSRSPCASRLISKTHFSATGV